MALNFEQRRQKILKNSSSRLAKVTGRPVEEFPELTNTQIWDELLKNNDIPVYENRDKRFDCNLNTTQKSPQLKKVNILQKYWPSIVLSIMVTLMIKLNMGQFIGYNLILPFVLIQPVFIFLNFPDILNDNGDSMIFMMLCSWLNSTKTAIIRTTLKILQYLIRNFFLYCFMLIFLSYFVN